MIFETGRTFKIAKKIYEVRERCRGTPEPQLRAFADELLDILD